MNDIGTAQDWLRRAKSNLLKSQQEVIEGIFLEDLCFDAHQCVEKSLKALLLSKAKPFRFTHDIAELLTNIQDAGVLLPSSIRQSAGLTQYAIETRYPANIEAVTDDHYKIAIKLAIEVYDWVAGQINFNKKGIEK